MDDKFIIELIRGRKMRLSVNLLAVIFIALVFISGCSATTPVASKDSNSAPSKSASDKMEIYEVHKDGRINVFYDRELYNDFIALGETPFRLTRIGAGPNGETVVFGLTKSDKKKPDTVRAINLYDKKINAPEKIYGEMRRHGRIYVFDKFEDMKPVREFGHPNYFYMEVGAGPKGETVVFVLNKHNKKKRPDMLIAEYKEMNK
jgi:hypothetical protein